MSIKVKHEGNATSAAFASKSGSEAKRRMQEGAAMAQVMQQSANASNQQLRGASAPGAAPGRSSAPLVHAPLMGAPATPLLPRMGAPRPAVPPSGGVRPQVPNGGIRVWNERTSPNPAMFMPNETEFAQQRRRYADSMTYGRQGAGAVPGGNREDEVVESTERFGQHSPDATWDPTNGGRWVRKWRPGEREAMAQDAQLSVRNGYAYEADLRALDKEKALIREKMNAEIGRDLGYRRNATAQQGDVNAQRQAAQDRKQEVIVLRSRGLPGDDTAWGGAADERDWGSEGLRFRDEPQQPSAQPAPPSSGYEKARSEGRSYYGDKGAASDAAPSGGSGGSDSRKASAFSM